MGCVAGYDAKCRGLGVGVRKEGTGRQRESFAGQGRDGRGMEAGEGAWCGYGEVRGREGHAGEGDYGGVGAKGKMMRRKLEGLKTYLSVD